MNKEDTITINTKILKYLAKNECAAYSINELADKLNLHPIDVAEDMQQLVKDYKVDRIVDTNFDTGVKTSKYKYWVRYISKSTEGFRVTDFPQPGVKITGMDISNAYKLIEDKEDLKELGVMLYA